MNKSKQGFYYVLIITTVYSAGCARPAPFVSPLNASHSILPSPTPVPTRTSLPTATSTTIPPLTRTPLPTLTPSPVPTYPPYSGSPFTIIFLRDNDIWLSEVGGRGERQLTQEPADWHVWWYAVSPTDDRVAYIPYQGPPSIDALVKQVHISSGTISVLAGKNDRCSEYDVQWLDATHITFKLQEGWVSKYNEGTCWQGFDEPLRYSIVVDLTTGNRTFVPEALFLSQSPNGRYWLTCSCYYVYECSCQYMLHNRVTGKKWRVAESLDWAGFLGWSPDTRFMLFSTGGGKGSDRPVRLAIIDVATRKEQVITPDDKYTALASWSPDGQTIASVQCDYAQSGSLFSGCALWLIDRNAMSARMIPAKIPDDVACLSWTPDGSQLVFARLGEALNTHSIWSVRLDGTDLVPIVLDAYHECFQILYNP